MVDQHIDPKWLHHMARVFRRWAKEAETEFARTNCTRLSEDFRARALLLEIPQ